MEKLIDYPMTLAKELINWYREHGRHHLPWQKNPTPYRVWVSEVMLQQTQVNTVIPYYQKFMKRFPDLKSLTRASIDDVLSYWSGLGYYARARNLHKTARIIKKDFDGCFPRTLKEINALPGIGRSTAGAILSFSMKIPASILDGNVKRVLTRYDAIEGWPGKNEILEKLWAVAEFYTPNECTSEYNQAIMDLGAMICTRSQPKCLDCPLQQSCSAFKKERPLDFPTKKTKKVLSRRAFYMLIFYCRKMVSVLLERRPSVGIWGGLWSFPECELDVDIERYHMRHNIKVVESKKLKHIIHRLDHLRLEITPLLISINSSDRILMDCKDCVWYKLSDPLPGGVAAPVKNLLQRMGGLLCFE